MRYIRVYNYSPSPVVLHGLNRDYTVNGRINESPMIEDIPEEEVNYINGKSNVFRNGILRFDDHETDSIMEMLRNPNWKETVLTEADIEDAIVHPSTEKLRRIVACTDRFSIERYRAALVRIQSAGVDGVSAIADRVIRQRFNEIANGIVASRIVVPEGIEVRRKDDETTAYEAMKSENQAMAQQLAELQKQLDELRSAQKAARATRKTNTPKTNE